MTVNELIAALRQMPSTAEVRVRWQNSCGEYEHNGVKNPRVEPMVEIRPEMASSGSVLWFAIDDEEISDHFVRLGARDVVMLDEIET